MKCGPKATLAGLLAVGCAENLAADAPTAPGTSDRIEANRLDANPAHEVRELGALLEPAATVCEVTSTGDAGTSRTVWQHTNDALPVERHHTSADGTEIRDLWLRDRGRAGQVVGVQVKRSQSADGITSSWVIIVEAWQDGRVIGQWRDEDRIYGFTWTWNPDGSLAASRELEEWSETCSYVHGGRPSKCDSDGPYGTRREWFWDAEGVYAGNQWSNCDWSSLRFTIENGRPTVGAGKRGSCTGESGEWTETFTWDDHGNAIAWDGDGEQGLEWVWEDGVLVSELRWRLRESPLDLIDRAEIARTTEIVRELEWDEAGRLTAVHDAKGTRTYRWDADGTLREATREDEDGWRSTTFDGICPEGVWRDSLEPDPRPSPGPDAVVPRGYGM